MESLGPIQRPVLAVLQVALYQMLYLSATPDFAAVDQAVRQARAIADKRTAGFVNAVLRSIQRDIVGAVSSADSPPVGRTLWLDENAACLFNRDILPDPGEQPARYLSLGLSHPLWLVERWLKRFDYKTTAGICQTDNSRPALTLRPNTLRCTAEKLMEQPCFECGAKLGCGRFHEATLQRRCDAHVEKVVL